MFAPKKQQVEICILKSNLQTIENDLVVQHSDLPALDAENEQKYRDTMAVLKVTRYWKAEEEKHRLENVQLTAKRMQLKRQCNEMSQDLETLRETQDKLAESNMQEEQEIVLLMCKFEESFKEKADRFRKAYRYYNEKEVNSEINKTNGLMAEIRDGVTNVQGSVEELRAQLGAIQPQTPENLLEIIEIKQELEQQLKSLDEKYKTLVETLQEKQTTVRVARR